MIFQNEIQHVPSVVCKKFHRVTCYKLLNDLSQTCKHTLRPKKLDILLSISKSEWICLLLSSHWVSSFLPEMQCNKTSWSECNTLTNRYKFIYKTIQLLSLLQVANMCSNQILSFLLVACFTSIGLADQYKIVDTENGKVRGIKSTSLLKGDPFYAFKGIPYAKPPLGDLRFKVMYWTISILKILGKHLDFELCWRPPNRVNHGNQPC